MNVVPARPQATKEHRADRARISGRRPRAAALLAALLMAMGSLLFSPATPATAAGNGEWSVDPFVPDGTNQNTRRYFFLEGGAGTTLNDVVSIANTSGRDLTFKLFGSDAYNTPRDGGFALRLVNEQQSDLGQWIDVPEEFKTITLQDKQRIQVPFTITIPPNATPGDHIGGIVALNTAIEGEQQQGPIQVKIQRQIGARIYLRVAGPTLPAIDLQDVRVERSTGFGEFFGSGKATIHYTVVNRGNVIIRPDLELSAKGLFGRTLLDKDKAPLGFELLPGQKVELKQSWNDAPRLDSVDLTVKVSTDQDGQKLSDSGTIGYVAIPWPSLLVLALLLIGGGVAWRLMRRGKGGKGGDGAEPKQPNAPSGGESSDDKPADGKPGDGESGAGDGTAADGDGDKPSVETPAEAPAVPAKAEKADKANAPDKAESPEKTATTEKAATPSEKSEPSKAEAEKAEAEKAEPAKTEPAKTEPAKAEAAGKSDAAPVAGDSAATTATDKPTDKATKAAEDGAMEKSDAAEKDGSGKANAGAAEPADDEAAAAGPADDKADSKAGDAGTTNDETEVGEADPAGVSR